LRVLFLSDGVNADAPNTPAAGPLLGKPFSHAELATRVRTLLDRHDGPHT
jgi:hypothetical protein